MVLFAVSFIAYPLWGMYKMYDEGKQEFELAALLRSKGIKGTFTSDAMAGIEAQRMERLAYFSGNPYFAANRLDTGNLNEEISKYHLDYYIVCLYQGNEDDIAHRAPRDESGNPFPEILDERLLNSFLSGKCMRIVVFKLQ